MEVALSAELDSVSGFTVNLKLGIAIIFSQIPAYRIFCTSEVKVEDKYIKD